MPKANLSNYFPDSCFSCKRCLKSWRKNNIETPLKMQFEACLFERFTNVSSQKRHLILHRSTAVHGKTTECNGAFEKIKRSPCYDLISNTKGITPGSGILPILGYTQAGIHSMHLYRSKFRQTSLSCKLHRWKIQDSLRIKLINFLRSLLPSTHHSVIFP